MSVIKGILTKDYVLDDFYKVQFFIKDGRYAETYRVKGKDNKIYFLKLFKLSRLDRKSFDDQGNILEIEILKKVRHPKIVSYKSDGEIIINSQKFIYLILDYISGETLFEKISREPFRNILDIKKIILDILDALDYLHNLKEPIIHNEITPHNIMIDLSQLDYCSKIIDFGHARFYHQSNKSFSKESLNLYYTASECFNGLFSPQSDIFSVGVIMYQLIFGILPWYIKRQSQRDIQSEFEELLLIERDKPLSFNFIYKPPIGYTEELNLILKKALSNDLELRFKSAKEFIFALNGEIKIEDIDHLRLSVNNSSLEKKKTSKKKSHFGFEAIAGMNELKEKIKLDVIDALKYPDEYARYGLTIPNGLLLFGPPGCGKTFFAKCLAEEVGCEFLSLTPADLKSKYVNETQEKIAKLFSEAEKRAPIIIFIDEINEILPNRERDIHEMYKSAVNEFLAQMDRTAEKGIFIIGATNFPHNIDPAALRAGRLEKKFYVPPPDFEARKALFKMYLNNRPLDLGIDYEKLANLTQNYSCADIKLITDEAARFALKSKSRITMSILLEIIEKIPPTISISELLKYEEAKNIFDKESLTLKSKKTRMGFIPEED